MANPSLIIGDGNWAVKSDSLLGYKTIDGKYYPRDMTFTRATTGTRVNAAGLVEVVPYNLALWSEQFDNAGWLTTGVVVSSNVEISPSGKLNADKLAPLSSSNIRSFNLIPISNNTTYTWSLYVKNAGARYIQFTAWTSDDPITVYDLDLVSIDNEAGPAHTSTIQDVGNGWRRITITRTSTSTSAWVLLRPLATPTTAPNNGIDGTYVWGAQLVEGTQPLTYLPTTTRLNIPRIDYSTGLAALLLEPQRTNLLQRSEEFDNAYWFKNALTVTVNSVTAPNGTLTADSLVENTVNTEHYISTASALALTAAPYTFSVYFKKANRDWVSLSLYNGTDSKAAWFNLNTGTLGTVQSGVTASIENFGNGWFRCSVTRTMSTGINYCGIGPSISDGVGVYLGNGLTALYAWGAQLVAGSYPTSYIPTTSASVTRNADTCTKTGVSSLVGQTEGTIYWEGIATYATSPYYNIFQVLRNSDYSKYIYLGVTHDGKIQIVSQTVPYESSSVAITPNTKFKVALRYKDNDWVLYLNGVQVWSKNALVASGTFDIFEQVYGGGYFETNKVYSNALFKTALTNSELAQLTIL